MRQSHCHGLLASLCLPVLALMVGAAGPAQASTAVIGEARGLEAGDFRYTEHHACSPDGRSCTVEYRDSSGEVFARKAVDFGDGLHSPSLVLEDFRRGLTREVEDRFGEDVVVDAGFDHYVRSRWDELAAGEEVKFSFLPAGRDEPLTMSARRDDERDCDPQALCLVISLDMWLISLLVDPIRLVYDDRRRLTQFAGVSNITTAEGDSQSVEINYRYLGEWAAPASPGR